MMAKTKICPICGKEYTTGFFGSSESGVLSFGKVFSRESSYQVSCCCACEAAYGALAKEEGPRFSAKLTNLKRAARVRLNEKKIAGLFLRYLQQREKYAPYEGESGSLVRFAFVTGDGRFCVTETDTGVSDFSTRDYLKSLDKMYQFDPRYVFGKEDVSLLEYRCAHKDFVNPFRVISTYEIRFNNEKKMSYKPCIARYIVVGRGLFCGSHAEKQMRQAMMEFQAVMKLDIPFVKVRKFR